MTAMPAIAPITMPANAPEEMDLDVDCEDECDDEGEGEVVWATIDEVAAGVGPMVCARVLWLASPALERTWIGYAIW